MGLGFRKVLAIKSAKYPFAAPSPTGSCVDCSRLGHRLGVTRPDWGVQVARFVAEVVRGNHEAQCLLSLLS